MNKTCETCPWCEGIRSNMVCCGWIPDMVTWAIADKRVKNKRCIGGSRYNKEDLEQ